jgi:hypothetical protein
MKENINKLNIVLEGKVEECKRQVIYIKALI